MLGAIASIILALLIGNFGTLRIDHVNIERRGSFPVAADDSMATDIFKTFPPPAPVMSGLNKTVFSLDWLRIKPGDCKAGMLSTVGRICVNLAPSPTSKTDNIRLPFFMPSIRAAAFFTVTADVSRTIFSSGWLRIAPDDCIESIEVNGVDVSAVRHTKPHLRCWQKIYNIDLSSYLSYGSNKVKLNFIDHGGKYGTDVIPFYSYPGIVMMVALAGISIKLLYTLFCKWVPPLQMVALRRYMGICSMSLSGVFTMFLLQAIVEGKWTWMPENNPLAHHLPQLAIEFMPIPFMFILWLRVVERDGPFTLRFSPLACALASMAFIITEELANQPNLVEIFFAASIIIGLFVMVPFGECLWRAILSPRSTLVAIAGATAACNYYWLLYTIWRPMCGWTTKMTYYTLRAFGANASTATGNWGDASFVLLSPHYTIEVYPGCSGLEGIFILLFLLSVFVLYDWDHFKTRRLLLRYALGIIFMFFVNVLRITSLFTLGYWAHDPHAWMWVQSLKGAPAFMFHTYVGWVFYLIAIVIFI